jgi:hypothetical protein
LDFFFFPSFGFLACERLQRSWLARSGSLLAEEERSLFPLQDHLPLERQKTMFTECSKEQGNVSVAVCL